MLDRLGPQLLELVRQSPEFQPAADGLTALAQAVQPADYPLSQRVLAALRRAQGAFASPPTPASLPGDPQ
jgi:spermidine synthase